jgi:hypothetical protein
MTHHFGNDWKPIAECDVSDKESLAVYRYFLKKWNKMLTGNDIHAISNQITNMLIADIEFRVINEAKKINNAKNRDQNEIIHRFIINGFVFPQYLRIRSLTERPSGSKEKAVYSLPTIINEIEENSDLITRENYVYWATESYDCKEDNRNLWFRIKRLHQKFDLVSMKNAKNRDRNDKINKKFFAEMRKKFEITEFRKLRNYVNKYLVHSADPNNRGQIDLFSFKDMDKIYRNICSVARELGEKILNAHIVFCPDWLYDPLEYMDVSLIARDDIDNIRSYWNSRKKDGSKF